MSNTKSVLLALLQRCPAVWLRGVGTIAARSFGVWVAMFGFLFGMASPAAAQGAPFTCDVVFYQVKNKGGVSQIVKFASVSDTITPTAVYAANQSTQINSLGYNAADNYMYGLASANAIPSLYRIGSAGYQLVGNIINSLPGGIALDATFFPTAGVFDAAGRYYFAGQAGANLSPSAIFRVDSIPATGPIQVSYQYNLSPTTVVNFGDFDFNGAGSPNGLLLGATGTNSYKILLDAGNSNPALGTASVAVVNLTAGPNGNNTGAIGSAFYDAFASKFYVFDNGNSDFWEITNPTGATSTPLFTNAVPFVGLAPFDVAGGVSPTDGTSCPISGARRADLAITKTDNVISLPTQSVTSYVITVVNNGPYPANYSTVRDPAAAGLTKTSVSCAAPGGPPSAVCPPTLSIASLEAGLQVVTFPPQTTLVFTVNAFVAGAPGTNVTNTATVTPAIDTTDPILGNNTAVDVNAVTATTSSVVTAASICPAGTAENVTNLVANPDFSAAAPFASEATVGGLNSYGVANFVSRQTGTQQYLPGGPIFQNQFPGDGTRSVGGSPNWLLSNGKAAAGNYRVWTQPVAGLVVGRTYEFMTYVSNATRPGTASPTLPNLTLQVSTGAATATLGTIAPANEVVASGDRWALVQGTFTATVSAVTLSISNFAAASAEPDGGDVTGIAQATLRSCDPSADVAVSKTNGVSSLVSTGTTAYTITVVNLTPGVNATNTLIVDPSVPNLGKTAITCSASAGSSCPAPASVTILAFEGAGLTIPLIAPLGTVTFVVAANVTGPPGSTATNFVTVSGVNYTDSNPANNQAQDSDPIRGSANLSVTKTNAVTALVAGGTTSYTVTVANAGPAQVIGLVLQDPAVSGLVCTSVTCVTANGATSCPSPAATTIAALQGAGIVLPSMSSASSLVFRVLCNVTATGQ